VIFEIYGIENNLASLETTVRFRVWKQTGDLKRLVDDCIVSIEGRYDIDAEGLEEAVEAVYNKEVLNG
jgi:hypothetical protein